MCYPYPGPRCSNHAHTEYLSALKAATEETNPDLKLALTEKTAEKLAVFDSTPRGQNILRREYDAEQDKDLKAQLKVRADKGKLLRTQQLEAYRHSIEAPALESAIARKSLLQDGNLGGKYAIASASAYSFVLDTLGEDKVSSHLTDKQTIQVTFEQEDKESALEDDTPSDYKIFVAPSKYQGAWSQVKVDQNESLGNFYTGVDEDAELLEILNSRRDYTNLEPAKTSILHKWFAGKLEEKGYRVVAIVNPRNLEITMVTVSELHDFTKIGVKLRPRRGGTSKFRGTVEELQQKLTGTPFSAASIIQTPDASKTILLDVLPLPVKQCRVGNLFMSYKPETESYEVRESHEFKTFDVFVTLNLAPAAPSGLSTATTKALRGLPQEVPEMTPESLSDHSVPAFEA